MYELPLLLLDNYLPIRKYKAFPVPCCLSITQGHNSTAQCGASYFKRVE